MKFLLLLFLMLPLVLHADGARTVLVFGDSITAGNELPADQKDRLWTKRVEEESGGRLAVVNEGKGGRPTDSLAEFDAMLARHARPDLLVLALGMNDSRDITDACVPKAVANLRAMIGKARAAWGTALPVLLVGPTNVNPTALVATKPIAGPRQKKLREMNAAFGALAAETGCRFIGLFGAVPDASLLRDGVHPDGAGNEALARVLLPAFLDAPPR
ncbi:MAG TPA: SGNH/GDSL hydrolase family protein [Candidatus Methylacidiphilales bacterium]